MEQTFLTIYTTPEGKQIDFFRHTQKQLASVKRQEKNFLISAERMPAIYRDIIQNKNNLIKIYQTPYEGNAESLVYCNTLKNLLNNIEDKRLLFIEKVKENIKECSFKDEDAEEPQKVIPEEVAIEIIDDLKGLLYD